jgi:hypothetical protein
MLTHAPGVVLPIGEDIPAGQSVQAVAPVVVEYLPAPQLIQLATGAGQ